MTTREERVLELAQNVFQLSRKIMTPVNIHKRYQFNDADDPHARLIEFVHHEGSMLWVKS